MSSVNLGNYVHVSVSVRNLRESSQFYETIGFKHLYGNAEPHPWALFTDGTVNIHLYEFSFLSPALHYFSSHMKDRVLELMRVGIRAEQQKSRDGLRTQSTFSDPNEFPIMLMHHSDADMPKPDGEKRSRLGVFGGLSINTENLNASVEFWTKLDYKLLNEGEIPYPWAILSDGVMTVGFHQTSSRLRRDAAPALTYFANDVTERIQRLGSESLPLQRKLNDENGTPEGAILCAPDGQLLFILKGHV